MHFIRIISNILLISKALMGKKVSYLDDWVIKNPRKSYFDRIDFKLKFVGGIKNVKWNIYTYSNTF